MTPRPGRLAILDWARGIALFAVVVSHFCAWLSTITTHDATREFARFLGSRGYVGTNTFLVISAFLLTRSLIQGEDWSAAVGRRMARIYPPFLVIFTVYVLAAPLYPGIGRIPTDPGGALMYLVANLFLLPGIFPIEPLVTVTWSLSIVVYGYVAVGFVFHLLAMANLSPAARAIVWLGLLWVVQPLEGSLSRLWFLPLGAFLAELNPMSGNPLGRISPCLPLSGWWAAVSGLAYATFLTHGLVLHLARALQWQIGSGLKFAAALTLMLTASGALAYAAQRWVFEPLILLLPGSSAPRGAAVPARR